MEIDCWHDTVCPSVCGAVHRGEMMLPAAKSEQVNRKCPLGT